VVVAGGGVALVGVPKIVEPAAPAAAAAERLARRSWRGDGGEGVVAGEPAAGAGAGVVVPPPGGAGGAGVGPAPDTTAARATDAGDNPTRTTRSKQMPIGSPNAMKPARTPAR